MEQFLTWAAGLVAAIIPGLGGAPPPEWAGYVEADYVYVAAATPGTIEEVRVAEGQAVMKGEVLFVLSSAQQRAALAAAVARVEAARATLENLETGSRQEEIDVIAANLSKAQADLTLATSTSQRSEELFGQGLIPAAKLDQDRASLAAAEAQVAQLDAQLAVAKLPARDAQQVGAEANLRAAEADADRARADLADRTVVAPGDGVIDRLFYAAGETAVTGVPVVSLLPGGALRAKFYVPETQRMALAIGESVFVDCDGCGREQLATISYLATAPQHTPPIIYSREERDRLVFLVEARLDADTQMLPGQPVTVTR